MTTFARPFFYSGLDPVRFHQPSYLIKMTNENDNFNICRSKMNTSKASFIWMIENFSDVSESRLGSGTFNSFSPSGNAVNWRLYIYPKNIVNETEFVDISIDMVASPKNPVSAKIKFMIRNSKGVDVEKLIIPNRNFSKISDYPPPNNFIRRDELLNTKMESGIIDVFEIPQSAEIEIEAIGHLFEQGLFTDCTIIAADGEKFNANKCILACQSPVFRAMFENDMIEAKEGIVNIENIESPVLEQMIKFMYTGKAPKLGEMAKELFKAADVYELSRLKVLCERELATSMGSENVCELLALANQHSAKNLKSRAIKYIKMHAEEVMKSKGWKILLKGNYADLVEEIFKGFVEEK